MKLCPTCKTEPRATTRTGRLHVYCRACERERKHRLRSTPEWKAAQTLPERRLAQRAASAKLRSTPEGKAAQRAAGAKWYAKNRAAQCAAKAKWYAKPENKAAVAKRRSTPEGRAYARAANAKWYAKPEGKADAIRRARETSSLKRQLVLSWAGDVSGEYDAAMALTEASGETYEVDHQVPLLSPYVSGLHVSANLCAIPQWLNRLKTNKVWPDMSDVSALDEDTVVRLTQAYEARRQCVASKQSVKACRTYAAALDTIFGELNEQTY